MTVSSHKIAWPAMTSPPLAGTRTRADVVRVKRSDEPANRVAVRVEVPSKVPAGTHKSDDRRVATNPAVLNEVLLPFAARIKHLRLADGVWAIQHVAEIIKRHTPIFYRIDRSNQTATPGPDHRCRWSPARTTCTTCTRCPAAALRTARTPPVATVPPRPAIPMLPEIPAVPPRPASSPASAPPVAAGCAPPAVLAPPCRMDPPTLCVPANAPPATGDSPSLSARPHPLAAQVARRQQSQNLTLGMPPLLPRSNAARDGTSEIWVPSLLARSRDRALSPTR
jgi:hypothetical protein